MRILSVCTNFPTEKNPVLGLFVHRRLAAMARQVQVNAIQPQSYFPLIKPLKRDPPILLSKLPVEARPMFYLPRIMKRLDSFWMSRVVGKWLDSIDDSMRGDAVLDAHFGYPEGVGCFRAAAQYGLPVFITIRGLEVDLFHQRNIGKQVVSALNQANGVIAVSQSLAKSAEAAGVESTKISVIPNGVDIDHFKIADKERCRSELKVFTKGKLAVCVGSLKPVKGHEILLRALSLVPRSLNVQLVCIGSHSDGDHVSKLIKLCREIGISDRVSFLGEKSPPIVAKWLSASDVFVLSSHREGCCNSVLEALATGTPVVATDAGDNAAYVSEDAGRIVPTGNAERLAEAMEQVLEGSFNQARISGLVQAMSWDNVATKVIRFMNCKTNPGSNEIADE